MLDLPGSYMIGALGPVAAGRDHGELLADPAVHVMGTDGPGHGGDRGAAGAGRKADGVLDALGQPLDVKGVAHDGLAKLDGGAGELAQDEFPAAVAGLLDGDVLLGD